jgi:hypothetical protein
VYAYVRMCVRMYSRRSVGPGSPSKATRADTYAKSESHGTWQAAGGEAADDAWVVSAISRAVFATALPCFVQVRVTACVS